MHTHAMSLSDGLRYLRVAGMVTTGVHVVRKPHRIGYSP